MMKPLRSQFKIGKLVNGHLLLLYSRKNLSCQLEQENSVVKDGIITQDQTQHLKIHGMRNNKKYYLKTIQYSVVNGQESRKPFLDGIIFDNFRSNNNIKNHFYSSLRKSIRRLNKFIKKYYLSKIKEQIQMTQLYTILQIFNTKFSDRIEFSVETIQDCCQIIKSLIEYININPLKLNKCERESITILIQSIHKFGKLIDKNQLKQQNSEDLSTLVQNQIKNTLQLCTLQKSNSDSSNHDYSKCDDSQNLFYFYNQINYQTIDQIEMPFNCQLDMGYIDFNDELYL